MFGKTKKKINQTTEDKLIEKRGQERDGESNLKSYIYMGCDVIRKNMPRYTNLRKNVFAWLNK